ncbi:hypothetical protein K501DRAFT_291621 [Backusella circina FSU 941]|nr:hypothetical protein K501DRAFT_291621 [Backusella circina FSU 941]
MSCPTFKVSVGIPVFGLGFTSSNQLIVGGGGGPGRSGVKNKLSSFKIDSRRKDLEEDAVFPFGADEDAPMCLDIHPQQDIVIAGVNGSEEDIKAGNNENCRMFKVTEDSIEKVNSLKTVTSKNVEDYQKVVRFSEDGSLFAVGTTTGNVDVFKYPSLKSICDEPVSVVADDEILDVDINLEKEKMIAATRDSLKLINLRGKNVGQIVQTISSTTAVKNNKVNFRAFRYGRGFSKASGFAVANGITKPGGYIIQYDAYTLEPVKTVQVTKKQITAFCISQDGSVLAFASSDLSISLLNAGNLKV